MTKTLLYDAFNQPLVTSKSPADFDKEHEMLLIALGLLTQQVRNPEKVARALVQAIIVTVGKEKIVARYPALEITPVGQPVDMTEEAEGVH